MGSLGGGAHSDGALPLLSLQKQKQSVGSNSVGDISERYSRNSSEDMYGIDTSRSRFLDTSRSNNPNYSLDLDVPMMSGHGSSSSTARGNGVSARGTQDNFALATPTTTADGRTTHSDLPSPHSPLSSSITPLAMVLPNLNLSNSKKNAGQSSSYIDDGHGTDTSATANHSESHRLRTDSEEALTTSLKTAAMNASNKNTSNSNTHTNNTNSGFVDDYSKYDDDNDEEYDTQFGFGVGAGKASPSSKKFKKAGASTIFRDERQYSFNELLFPLSVHTLSCLSFNIYTLSFPLTLDGQ